MVPKRTMAENSGRVVRLHVGGLGETVGKDDLLKIFAPMGSVDSVEFVRTKGRSFAYINFSPSSNNSLTKLFSTYNGCVWKGGRLRLEKAKEHYLARLKREWEEESSASDNTIQALSNSTPSTHLNVFFPKLRKVKALPLSGTGKHKYSFQRVPVPSLSKNFCDCEEHSNYSLTRENHVLDLEALNEGINEEEVSVMNSVMNKLFQKNNIPNSEEQVPEEDNETEADQDNLVINVVSGGKDIGNSELDFFSRERRSILNEKTASRGGNTKGRKGNHINPSNKKKSIILEGTGRKESSQCVREKNKPSEGDPDKLSDEPSRTIGVKRSSDNISWSQKSSWKALMGNGNSSNFSVSSVLPAVGSSKAEQPALWNIDGAGLLIRENSNELDVLKYRAEPTVRTKNKKTKSEQLTASIMVGSLPVADDTEMEDIDAVEDDTDAMEDDTACDPMEDDTASDAMEDYTTNDAEEDDTASNAEEDDTASNAEEDDTASDAMEDYTTNDAEKDDTASNAEEDDTASDAEEDDTASDAVVDDTATVEDDTASDVVEDDIASDTIVEDDRASDSDAVGDDTASDGVEDDIASDTNVEDDTASDAISSDDSVSIADTVSDTNVEAAGLDSVANTEGDNGKEKLNVEKHDNVAEDLKAYNKSTGGPSWLQKASWTQLVNDNNPSSFSITQLFPDLNKCEPSKTINNKDGDCQYINSNQSQSALNKGTSTGSSEAAGFPVDSTTTVRSSDDNRQSLNSKKLSEGSRLGARKLIRRKIGSGETCGFMRSSASLKEWAKAKKALSEPRKKRQTEE